MLHEIKIMLKFTGLINLQNPKGTFSTGALRLYTLKINSF